MGGGWERGQEETGSTPRAHREVEEELCGTGQDASMTRMTVTISVVICCNQQLIDLIEIMNN